MNKKTEKRVSALSGELVAPGQFEIPFAPGFNIDMLREVDPDPVFATVKIKAGNGDQGGGPFYGSDILSGLEKQINTKRPPGYKGHQDAEKVSWEWREPVTAWVGARFIPEEDSLYVKGYVPPTAAELRTQLDLAKSGADVVNSVSIFGMRAVDGDQVTDFDLWSLDWTPKGRAGMETELVAVSGEQVKEETMDRDEVIRSLTVDEVPEHIVAAISETVRAEGEPAAQALGEMRVILELDETTDGDAIVSALKGLIESQKAVELEEKVAEMVSEKVSGDLVGAAVRDTVLPKLSPSSTEEEISGEIASALELPYIAALKDGTAIPTVQGGVNKEETRKGTAWAS